MTTPVSPSIRFVVIHTPGPAWLIGVDFREQPGVYDHVRHYQHLHAQGKLELGGPFLIPDLGGMMVTTKGVTREEIEAFAAADPAVGAGLLQFEVRPWYTAMERSLKMSSLKPRTSRPNMPEYGLLDAGQGLLPWEWAQERLENAHNYWVATTRPDGRPHVVAVWGVWWEATFYFSTGRLTRKARNLAQNPSCVVCTENAAEAVIVEGVAQLVTDEKTLGPLNPIYRQKYGSAYPEGSYVYAVQPKVVFGFIEDEAEFSGSATRWSF